MIILRMVLFILLLGCIFPIVLLFRYEQTMVRERISHNRLFAGIYSVCLWMADYWISLFGVNGGEKEWADAVYIGKKPDEQYRLRIAKRFLYIWVCLIIAVLSCFLMTWWDTGGREIQDPVVNRPEFGEIETYTFDVKGIDPEQEKKVSISFPVNGKQPNDEQVWALFAAARDHAVKNSLGKNKSIDEIRSDMSLVSSSDYGIKVDWKSESPELISDRGTICSEKISEEGEDAILRMTLTYDVYSFVYDIELVIYPAEKDYSYYYNQLMNSIHEEEQKRDLTSIKLPLQMDDNALKYYEKRNNLPWGIILLILFSGGMLAAADIENLKKEYQYRQEHLINEYSGLVFRLNLMMSCGMTLRNSWELLIQQYRNDKSDSDEIHYLYEEMLRTQADIQTGNSEAAAYQKFGKRCNEDCYIRLGNYLAQNMKQGVSGLKQVLYIEMNQALEEKKSRKLRMSETVNTRLLLPMVGMLCVVMAVLISPAMLSF